MGKRWTDNDLKNLPVRMVKDYTQQPNNRVVFADNKLEKNVSRVRTKYGNIKTNGFDSKKEAEYYQCLKLKEHAHLVTGIQTQVVFQLSVCKYVADFVFFDAINCAWKVVDVKSEITRKLPVYRLKKKMMLNELNIKILEV